MQRSQIRYGPERGQVADLWRPEPARRPAPVVVLIHGGYWRSRYGKAWMRGLARAVVDCGWAAWNVEYARLGPFGRGGWPSTFRDVHKAIEHLARIDGIDTGRVATCGHSAGGMLALWAAGRHRLASGSFDVGIAVRGAIGLAPLSDAVEGAHLGLGRGALPRLLGGEPAEVPGRYGASSPSALLPLGVPQVLIHGEDDISVPLAMSRRYCERAGQAGDDAALEVLAGVGHRQLLDPSGPGWAAAQRRLDGWFA